MDPTDSPVAAQRILVAAGGAMMLLGLQALNPPAIMLFVSGGLLALSAFAFPWINATKTRRRGCLSIAVVCFIVAFAYTIILNSRSSMHIDFQQMNVFRDEHGGQMLIALSIRNTGDDSVVQGCDLTAQFPGIDERIKAIAITMPPEISAGKYLKFYASDLLAGKVVNTPIVKGGQATGVVFFEFRGVPAARLMTHGTLPSSSS